MKLDKKDYVVFGLVIVVMVSALLPTYLEYRNANNFEYTGKDCSFPGAQCEVGSYCRVYEVTNDSYNFSSYKGYCVKSKTKFQYMLPPTGTKNSPCSEFGDACNPGLVCCYENTKVYEDLSVDCRSPTKDQYGTCVCTRVTPTGDCDMSGYV